MVYLSPGWPRDLLTVNSSPKAYTAFFFLHTYWNDLEPVEIQPNPDPNISLPVHQIMLAVNGIHLLERMKLDELATSDVYEFALIVQPLKLQGGTGSTVAPIAIR